VTLLPQSFFDRDVLTVSRELIGKLIVRDDVTLAITEVEAYAGPDDSASHSRSGRTARNAPAWGPGGHLYMYLCYGLHNMLNISADRDGFGSAVLVRACEIVAGERTVCARRGGKTGPVMLNGPGKVGAALELDTSWSHHPVYTAGGVELHDSPPRRLLAGPRVGIDFATPRDRKRRWRYAAADTDWVSHPKSLTRWRPRVAKSARSGPQ